VSLTGYMGEICLVTKRRCLSESVVVGSLFPSVTVPYFNIYIRHLLILCTVYATKCLLPEDGSVPDTVLMISLCFPVPVRSLIFPDRSSRDGDDDTPLLLVMVVVVVVVVTLRSVDARLPSSRPVCLLLLLLLLLVDSKKNCFCGETTLCVCR